MNASKNNPLTAIPDQMLAEVENLDLTPEQADSLRAQAEGMRQAANGETPLARIAYQRAATPPTPTLRRVTIPEAERGPWRVERMHVSEQGAFIHNLRETFKGHRFIEPGTYTRLMHASRGVVMSDTPAELLDHRPTVYAAQRLGGRVLIHGLGIGAVLQAMCDLPNVDHVTVVDVDPDVVAMVAPAYKARYGAKLDVICADAFTWRAEPGTRWDVVWHDIWDTIGSDNLPEMHKLHRRYGNRCRFQASWCREECEVMRSIERRYCL